MKYIDAEKLIAEIETRKNNNLISASKCPTCYFSLVANEDIEILVIIDSLQQEQPEVDLEKEVEKCLKQHQMVAVGKKDFTDIARHFYKLGLNARKK